MKKIVTINSLLSIEEMISMDSESKKSFLWNMVSSDHYRSNVSEESAIVLEGYEYDQIQKMTDQELNEALGQVEIDFKK